MAAHPRLSNRGFSVVELVVVLAVVAVIAALSIPTFELFVRRSSNQVNERSLSSVVTGAWVLGMVDGTPHYSVDRLAAAAADTSSGGDPWTVQAGEGAVSGGYGELAAAVVDDGETIAVAMRDRAGGCSYLLGWRGHGHQLWSAPPEAGSSCGVDEAMKGPGLDEGPLVTVP